MSQKDRGRRRRQLHRRLRLHKRRENSVLADDPPMRDDQEPVRKKQKKTRMPSSTKLSGRECIFSVVHGKIQFPSDYEGNYYRIRSAVMSERGADDSGVEDSSMTYHIRSGTQWFQAQVQLYDIFLKPKKKCIIKLKKGVSVPFIEPYVGYLARFNYVPNNKWVDRIITKIIRIIVLPFSLTVSGLLRLMFFFRRGACGFSATKTNGCVSRVRHSVKLRSKRNVAPGKPLRLSRSIDSIVDIKYAIGRTSFVKIRETSFYYLLTDLLNAQRTYETCISFKNLVTLKITRALVVDLKNILTNKPWEMALPSNWERFSINPILPAFLRKMETVFMRINRERQVDVEGEIIVIRFPSPYYWSSYIYHAIKKMEDVNKNLYTDYSSVYDKLKTIQWRVSAIVMESAADRSEITRDPVLRRLATAPFSSANALRWFLNDKDASDGWNLLTRDGSLFFIHGTMMDADRARARERLMGLTLMSNYNDSPQRVQFKSRYRLLLRAEEDTEYGFSEENTALSDGAQHIYTDEVWSLQTDIRVCMRLLLAMNNGYNQTIPVADNSWETENTRLNELQRTAMVSCTSSAPITIVEGAPGTGKTEVIKSFCDSMDFEGSYVMIGGVNGITCNVLKKRLDPSVSYDCSKKDGIHARVLRSKRTMSLCVMTLDMMNALSHANVEECVWFNDFIDRTHTLVIDEVQNVDMKRFMRVLPLFRNLTRLRLFGDFDQIEAICIGQIIRSIRTMIPDEHSVVLTQNNRVVAYPNSQSIVYNFRAITTAKDFDINYTLRDDDEGSHFLTLNETKTIQKIVSIYKDREDPMSIDIITPMNVSVVRLNRKLGDILRNLAVERMGLKVERSITGKEKVVPFVMKTYTMDDKSKITRYFLRVGTKVRFCKNYKEKNVILKKNGIKIIKSIMSSAVYNGEKAWITRVSSIKIPKAGLIWVLHLKIQDGSRKKIVVGEKHVDGNDITEGWATTIDAMLGGQNKTIILYLGRFYNTPAGGKYCPILTNFMWVDKNRFVSGISRAERYSYVIGPRVTLTRDRFKMLMNRRERKKGRVFKYEHKITRDVYSFDTVMILKIMASLLPRNRHDDLEDYLPVITEFNHDLDENFLMLMPTTTTPEVKSEESIMDTD